MIYEGPETLPDVLPESMTQMILDRIAATPDAEALRYPDADENWQSMTWAQVGDEAEQWAAALIHLGCQLEDRVGIASETCRDWMMSALATSLAGCAVMTVYPQTDAEDMAFELNDSGTRVLFAEDESQLAKVQEKRDEMPGLGHVVLFSGEGDGDFSLTLEQLKQMGAQALAEDPNLVKNRAAQVTGDLLATLIYTSGTTGRPKGVELLHSSWGYVGAAMNAFGVLRPDDVEFRWLPMAHVFGSTLMAGQIHVGYACAIDGRPAKILSNISVIKPTFMGAVPRIFEKAYAAVNAVAKARGPETEARFEKAKQVAQQYSLLKRTGQPIPADLQTAFEQVDKEVLSLVRAGMGGNVRFFISGSAQLAPEISAFFDAAAMPVLEGYGLTETCCGGTIGRPDSLKPGSVGQPWPGTEIKIADDGEILMRGPEIMRGYRDLPAETAEVFLGDGWFATGDIGEFDDQSRLTITDRKKNLLKTSNGKYVAPAPIESKFKADCGLASNIIIEADNRKFVSALVTLDPEAVAAWAPAHGKPADIATLSKDPDVIAEVQEAIDKVNATLNHWEKIQKFAILDHDLSVKNGELTASLKVRRKVVEQENQELLNSFYA